MIAKKYYFIGIGGISMSALALYLQNHNCVVSGSDVCDNSLVEKLKTIGIKVNIGHSAEYIENFDFVVYSYAIKEDNPEIIEARKKNIPLLSRGKLLGMIAKEYKTVIAVAGSHGKTTTTAMLYSCLKSTYSVCLHLGGVIKNCNFGYIDGKEIFLTEACEYHDAFLNLRPNIAITLNIEKEHLDYFKNFSNEISSYKNYEANSQIVVSNQNLKKGEISFGLTNEDIIAKNIKLVNHHYEFDCYIKNEYYNHFRLGAFGKYNVKNALSAIAVCNILNVEKEKIYQGLVEFTGVKRRFESLNENFIAIHDYAHHPTEIKKTIQTMYEIIGDKKLVIVFQPHTYSRTKTLMEKFKHCFNKRDKLYIYKTYPAREKYDKKGSANHLCKVLKSCNYDAHYFANEKRLIINLLKLKNLGYAILILGAGNIDEIAYNFAKLC